MSATQKYRPTRTAVIKALGKVLGDTSVVFPASKLSSVPGFYVTQGLHLVSGPTVIVNGDNRAFLASELADLLIEEGFDVEYNAKKFQITVNAIPKGFNR